MYINQATDYAIRAMVYMAVQPEGKVVDAQKIAKSQVIPMRFLLKFMPSLIKAGIVKSQRGVGGGYMLAKSPDDITLFDIISAMEGPVIINRCLIDYEFCSRNAAPGCKIHQALSAIQGRFLSDLKSFTLRSLI